MILGLWNTLISAGKGLGMRGNGHCCWSCSAPPAAGKRSAHRGQEERNLGGSHSAQRTPHAHPPGTRPATQESEATVWTSEHRHESAGDKRKGFTADCASYQILAELGSLARKEQQHLTGDPKNPARLPTKSQAAGGVSHLSAVRSALSFSAEATSESSKHQDNSTTNIIIPSWMV